MRKKDDLFNEIYPYDYHHYDKLSHESKSIYFTDINKSPAIITNWNYVLG